MGQNKSKLRISSWKIERYRLGELDAEQGKAVAEELANNELLRAELRRLEDDDRAALAAYPPNRVIARVKASVAPRRALSIGWWAPAFVLAGAVALTVIIRSPPLQNDEIFLKGNGPRLRIFRLAGQEPERLSDGARVRTHDVVQVAFDLAGAPHLVIVSTDGAHGVTLHWPRDGSTAVPSGFRALPEAFELDEAPGFERFFLVTSTEPLDPRAIVELARGASRTGPLALPRSVRQHSILLEKTSP